MPIGNGIETYSDNTLKSMSKDKLIEFIRSLEYNLKNACKENELQRKIFKKMLEEEKQKNMKA